MKSMATTTELRSRLEEERDRIAVGISDTREQMLSNEGPNVESAAYGNHLADEATETFEDQKILALETHQRGLLAEIEQALQRMDDGTYGQCADCGQPIAPERLEALPWASLCIDCKARAEQRR
jgi:DnaK suppressor protein